MGANPKELGVIKVAKPCHRDWAQMTGDERARFCADCKLTVYDLSAMTTDEARELIRKKEGELCVRFFQRTDGTVLTKDCPVGVSMYRRRMVAVGVTAVSMSVLGLAMALNEVFEEAASVPAPVPFRKPAAAVPVVTKAASSEPAAAEPAPADCAHTEPEAAAPPTTDTDKLDDGWVDRRRAHLGSGTRQPMVMGKMIRVVPGKTTGKKH